MNKKIIYSLLIIACLLFCTMFFIKGSISNKTEPLVKNKVSEVTNLEWYVNFSWFESYWGNDIVSKKIIEKTGTNILFEKPLSNESGYLETLINSKNIPDIITLGWWEDQVEILIKEDLVYPLNELADEYFPYFYHVADEEVLKLNTKEDGNIYYYPNSVIKPSEFTKENKILSNITFVVKKDIYEAIGKPDMTTPEGFYNAIKKATQMFPEISGEKLIPIGAHEFTQTGNVSFDIYLQDLLAIPYENDGKFHDRFSDENYLMWLKTFRRLAQDGYLAPDIFTDKRIQMEEKIAKGQYFCMIFQRTDFVDQQKKLFEKDPSSIYIAVDGPKNINGDDHILPGGSIKGWTATMISKKCKDPQKAMELISYMMSEEGQKLVKLGVEGEMYEEVNGKIIIQQDIAELFNKDREKYDRIYGGGNKYWMFQNNIKQLKWEIEEPKYLAQLEEWTYPYTNYLAYYDVTPKNKDIKIIKDKIEKLWSKVIIELLLAETDQKFDEIFNKFLQDRNNIGFDIFAEEMMKEYQKAKDELNIK